MAADANIFQQYLQAPKSVLDYGADMDRAEGNRLTLALQRQQVAEGAAKATDASSRRNAIQQVYTQLGPTADPLSRARALQANPLTAADGIAAEKAINENAHLSAQTRQAGSVADKNSYETQVQKADKAITDIASYTSPQQALQQLQVHRDAGDIDPQRAQLLAQQIQAAQTPGDFATWQVGMLRGIMSAKERLTLEQQKAIADQTAGVQVRGQNLTSETARRGQDLTAGTARRGQDMVDARAGQAFNAPQYMETDQGLVALPKKLAPGQAPTATPVMGTNGTPLGKPLKDIPAAVNTAIIANSQNLGKVQQAIELLSGKNSGGAQGDANATGLKGYVPGAILNRTDPQGVETRAAVADIGSMIFHDRSGAAVTVAESPRLVPFIPLTTDDNATAVKKLTRLQQVIQSESQALGDTYSKDQGYKPSPVLTRTSSGGNVPPSGTRIAPGAAPASTDGWSVRVRK